MPKIMRIYYDNAGYPYKDSALSVRYPIVEGGEFTGANNTTEVHFYTENMGSATWVANCKLPDGTLVNRLLVSSVDSGGIPYQNLPLDSQLTSVKGHLKIGLNGYSGNISVDTEDLDENEIVVISGTPQIIATGIIDIAMNYSPIVIPVDDLTYTQYQQLLTLIGNKLDIANGIYVATDISVLTASNYNENQIFYDKETKLFYRVVSGAFVLEQIDIGELNVGSDTLDNVISAIESDIDTKVDKLSSGDSIPRVYGYVGSTQTSFQTDDGDMVNGALVVRDNNNQIKVPTTPTDNNHSTSKYYVDSGLSGKVDKSSTHNIVYATTSSGNQTTIEYDTFVSGPVVRRVDNNSGNIYVGTPTATNHATPKQYVDNQVSSARTYAKNYADTLFTSTLVYSGTLSVAQVSALDTSSIKIGAFYNVSDSGTITWTYNGTTQTLDVLAGDNIAWTGSGWDKLTMDLSVYDDKFISAGFFEVQDYDEVNGTITLVYASDLYDMSYSESTGILTIEAN